MSVTFLSGCEAAAEKVDDFTISGTAAYSTAQARTGTRSIRCNPASSASGAVSVRYMAASHYTHFGLYVASLPSVTRRIYGSNGAWQANVRLTSSGTLQFYVADTLIGTSATAAFAAAGWHWVGINQQMGTDIVLLQIDGVDEVTGTTGTVYTSDAYSVGAVGTEASAVDLYIDDFLGDDSNFLAPSKVGLHVPISDFTRSTEWTGGSGGTTNLWEAVNNCPPVGSATESDTTQIEHAGGQQGSYVCDLTTFTTVGVGANDTIIATMLMVVWGEDAATGTKYLTYTGYSNPQGGGENTVDVSTGHGSGAVGTYSTGTDYWNERRESPPVTSWTPALNKASGTKFQITRPDTGSRVASVCFMGMYTAWTPAAAAPAKLAGSRTSLQAVNRAAVI